MNPEDGHSLQEISSDTDLAVDQSTDEVTLQTVTDGASASKLATSPAKMSPSHTAGMSPSHPAGMSPSHPAGMSPSRPAGMSPSHPAKMSPSHPAKMSPSRPGYYRIRGLGERGLGIILCNIAFSPPLRNRNTAVADRDNMSRLFTRMGLRVEIYSDLRGPEVTQLISDCARRDFSQFDCLFMAVSSHGDRGCVLGTDGVPVPIESHILAPFNGANCPTLTSKPKVFFLQACRGNEKDFCVNLPDNETDGNGATEQATRLIEKIRHLFATPLMKEVAVVPTELDFFVAYSTVPGYVSWRNTEKGSWFLYALCECYYQYGSEVHLSDLLTYVTDFVTKCFSDTDEDTKRIAKQVICCESRLSKFLKVPADRKE